ncbi:hypothetical protein HJC23_012297 [Cyclotella cryptica]|uniref:Cyclin N-terminal domain-containing protein n=1 Tax=Cyclotella cryptica TaxID=29204 RepID=A0ABD3PLR0_9STRA
MSPNQSQLRQQARQTRPLDFSQTISVIQVMKRQELTAYRTSDYLDHSTATHHDRLSVCQWGFKIVDACGVDRNIAVIAITYLDRFLSCRGSRVVELCLSSQREFQLAFVVSSTIFLVQCACIIIILQRTHLAPPPLHRQACLVISLKGREGIKVAPDFVSETLCSGMYHPEEVIEMELQVLRSLGWLLNGPTPQDFIQSFMELLPCDACNDTAAEFYETAVTKSEMAMLDYSLAMESPSSVAIASVASSMSSLDAETRCRLDASNWMSRIGFVMGIAMTNLLGEQESEVILQMDDDMSESSWEKTLAYNDVSGDESNSNYCNSSLSAF